MEDEDVIGSFICFTIASRSNTHVYTGDWNEMYRPYYIILPLYIILLIFDKYEPLKMFTVLIVELCKEIRGPIP